MINRVMSRVRRLSLFLLCIPLTASGQVQLKELTEGRKSEWIKLFNGNDLKDWIPVFVHHEPGDKLKNTFRVNDGRLLVIL